MRRSLSNVLLPVAAAVRSFYFSEGATRLKQVQAEKGYKSNLWFRSDDLKYAKAAAKTGEVPVDAMVIKQLELFNFDELDGNLPPTEATDRHSSFSTKKPYGQQTAFELESRAAMKGLRSHWWIHPQSAKKMGLQPKPRTKSTLLLMHVQDSLYNVEQLADPAAAKKIPFSGGTRRVYSQDRTPQLMTYLAALGAQDGLLFTEQQMKALHLEGKQDSVICELVDQGTVGVDEAVLFNVKQVEDSEGLLASRNVTTTPVPSFLTSGAPIKNMDALQEIALKCGKFNCNFYLSKRDMDALGVKALPGEVGIPFSTLRGSKVLHVSQLVDPAKGYEMCGRLTR